MANIVFNIGLGRSVELYNRVKNSDPGTSRLVIMILATAGLENDTTVLKLKDTFADVVSGSTNEVTNTGYTPRKVLAAADLAAWIPATLDTLNAWDLSIPNQTWNLVGTGDGWSRFVVGYDPTSAGVTNSLIVPLTMHDFVVTPDGSDITAQISATGFFRAS